MLSHLEEPVVTVTVRVWSWLSATFGLETTGSRTLEIQVPEGATILDLLKQLGEQYPRFGSVMFEADGEPSDQVSVVLNDRLPELGEGLETRLRAGDRVTLVQAYAGG
jgi:molybdopterin converting factor small subunit